MIHYPEVETAVLAVIQGQVTAALDQEKLLKQLKGSHKEKSLIDKYAGQVSYLTQELKKVNSRRGQLYESFTEGLLDGEEYRFVKQKYDDQAEKLGSEVVEAKAKKKELDEVLTFDNKWLVSMRESQEYSGLDVKNVDLLVESVRIYESRRV